MFKKRWVKVLLLIFIMIVLIQFLPMLILKTFHMKEYSSEHFTFFYEDKDYDAMLMIRDELEGNVESINNRVHFSSKEKTEVFIYPNQRSLQIRKYGTIVLFFHLEWYIGDNIYDKIIVVSPNNPGPQHSQESVIGAVAHEYVHTVMVRINKKIPLWLNEGMALYLTNGEEVNSIQNYYHIPTFEETKTTSPIVFAESGGYQFAHTYIAYLVNEYGMEKVIKLIEEPNQYQTILGVTEEEVYHNWRDYLEVTYP